jgi:hypothetical protein
VETHEKSMHMTHGHTTWTHGLAGALGTAADDASMQHALMHFDRRRASCRRLLLAEGILDVRSLHTNVSELLEGTG